MQRLGQIQRKVYKNWINRSVDHFRKKIPPVPAYIGHKTLTVLISVLEKEEVI